MRTQGSALTMHRATKMHVKTPANLTGPGLSSRSLNNRTKRKISHAKADVAQPEWTPPRCWRIEVQPRRNHKGVHCKKFQSMRNVRVVPEEPLVHTFANNLLVSKYKSRPNSSLRARIAATRLPKTSAPVYFLAYCHVPKIARTRPIIFSEMMKVKNFLMLEHLS